MAKVKIQGHASGTGILTVTAPNTSTDRTITLPDATGTLATTADVPSSITDNGDATAITIDSSENVGIGVTPAMASASYNGLHIGATYPTMKLSSTSSGHAAADGFHLRIDSTPRVEYWNYENTDQVFANNNGEKLRLLAAGGITFNGDTAAANALDDYEEGTWTPTFHLNHIGSHTLNYANYVKVGRLVTINMYVYNFGSIGGTGISFGITSLPFSQNVQALGVVTATHTDFHNSYGHAVARLYNGVAYIEQTKDAASGHWLDYSAFNANSHVQMSITYETSV